MPDFIPFKALRPAQEFASKVSARSTDFPDQNFLIEGMRENPYSYHHVTKSHLNYSGSFQEPEKFFPFAAKFVQDMKGRGVLIKDTEDSFYVYRQSTPQGRTFTGIIGLSSVNDYNSDLIRKHEETRPHKLSFMVELSKTVRVLGEPTLMTYPENLNLQLSGGETVCDFMSVDGKHHLIERISMPEQVKHIHEQFQKVKAFYLADGHHRSAAMSEFRSKHPQLDNSHFISLLIQESELEISSFHRLIRSIEKIETDELLQKLSRDFTVSKIARENYIPKDKGQFGMYDGKDWYSIKLKYQDHMMDVELLEKYVVRTVYNITDSRMDSQISFTPQHTPLDKLETYVKNGTFNVVYTLSAPSFEEIREIADRHETLPPKSTFIEPKLRSGMIIQEF